MISKGLFDTEDWSNDSTEKIYFDITGKMSFLNIFQKKTVTLNS